MAISCADLTEYGQFHCEIFLLHIFLNLWLKYCIQVFPLIQIRCMLCRGDKKYMSCDFPLTCRTDDSVCMTWSVGSDKQEFVNY